MLQDDLNQMMGVAKNADGSSGSPFSVFLFVLTYMVLVGFLLVEAITGYIVQVMTETYTEGDVLENANYSAVARIEVKKWFRELKDADGQLRLASEWPDNIKKSLSATDVCSVEHVKHMLTQIKKEYDLEFAQVSSPLLIQSCSLFAASP